MDRLTILAEVYRETPKAGYLYEYVAYLVLIKHFNKVIISDTFDFYIPDINAFVEVKYNQILFSENQKKKIAEGYRVLLLTNKRNRIIDRILFEEEYEGFTYILGELSRNFIKEIKEEVKLYEVYDQYLRRRGIKYLKSLVREGEIELKRIRQDLLVWLENLEQLLYIKEINGIPCYIVTQDILKQYPFKEANTLSKFRDIVAIAFGLIPKNIYRVVRLNGHVAKAVIIPISQVELVVNSMKNL